MKVTATAGESIFAIFAIKFRDNNVKKLKALMQQEQTQIWIWEFRYHNLSQWQK